MLKFYISSFVSLLFVCPLILFGQLPSGSVGQYPLNNSAIDISGNNNTGTLSGTTGVANRFGISNSATQFNSGSSYGSLPRIMQDNFTIGFWFNTTMNASSSTMWYGGNSLINAEVCGVTNDWGTALINGGQVCMGIGNPDMTIFATSSNYNDGNWHFVTAVRDETDGIIILYVDAVQVATGSGTNTGTLNAPGAIGLGRDATFFTGICGSGTPPNYTGSLDDIIVYDRVLSSTEVTNLYVAMNSAALPLDWLSFTGTNTGNGIRLDWSVGNVVDNNYFVVEHSTDAQHFSSEDSLPNSAAIAKTTGSASYTSLDANPANGANYYRIKQVDLDGNYSWSNTIEITNNASTKGFSLFPNPVHGDPVLLNTAQQYIQELRLVDVSGKHIAEQYINSNSGSITVDSHLLSPGYYFLQVEGASGAIAIMPFVEL